MKKLVLSIPWTRLYPFLVATYATLHYFSYDLHKVVISFCVTLGVSLAITAAVFGLLHFFYKDPEKRSLATFLIVVLFFFFGIIHDSTITSLESHVESASSLLFAGCLLGLALSLFALKKLPRLSPVVSQFLTVTTLSMVVYSMSLTGNQAYADQTGKQFSSNNLIQLSGNQKPDIYYLVFDDYGGNQALKDLFNFDNTPFLDDLKSRGFYVAEKSTTNYNGSLHSLASTLNLNYLDQFTDKTTNKTDAVHFYQELVENNQVVQNLKNNGYHYYHFGSWFLYTRFDHNADANFYPTNTVLGLPYYTALFLSETTLLKQAEPQIFPFIHRKFATYEVEQTPSLTSSEVSPKFVFTHVLLPHGPNVFTADCQPGDKGYVEQLQCTNRMILTMVDAIKKQSKTPPIIILQTDEGSDVLGEDTETDQWTDRAIKEKYPILAAYYLPDQQYSQFYPTMTSVNSFRLIFNHYFQANLPLLPDKNYLMPDYTQLDNPLDITPKIQELMGTKP